MKLLTLILLPLIAHSAAPKIVNVSLVDGQGKPVGTAKISAAKKGVIFQVAVSGLSPGEHAIHVHEKAECVGPDFKSAGGHFSPEKREHGLENPNGHHAGDMRNFVVGKDGKAKFAVVDESVTLEEGTRSLLSGTSLVIHAKQDDYKSQPAGNAGDRVVCGVIKL